MALAISYDRIPTMNKNTTLTVEKQYSTMTSDWRGNFGMRERERERVCLAMKDQ